MDLKQTLLNRASDKRVPSPEQRTKGANEMIEGYQNGWTPNPVITNLLEKAK